MGSLIVISLVSLVVIAVTCLITYEILRHVWNLLPRMTVAPRLRALLIVIPIFAVHIINIWLYAGVYYFLGQFTSLGTLVDTVAHARQEQVDFLMMLYFSAATYTSLGFGDVIPAGNLRMLSSTEVLNGLVMIGWTVSFTYLTMEKFWALPHHGRKQEGK